MKSDNAFENNTFLKIDFQNEKVNVCCCILKCFRRETVLAILSTKTFMFIKYFSTQFSFIAHYFFFRFLN